MRLSQLGLWPRVVFRLGVANVLRVALYRLGVRTGLHPVRWQRCTVPEGPFYGPAALPAAAVPPVAAWGTTAPLFGRWAVPLSNGAPDWASDPITGRRLPGLDRAWWQIPDFDEGVGDIKRIWEMSRMDWVIAFAQRARQGDAESLQRLNRWLADWSEQNPPYRGPNWKCGQEASIRVLHLAMAALILGQQRTPLPGLRDLVHLHLKRIGPTLQYAVAQDNNHGTSEAAALFIGGSWLRAAGVAGGARWEAAGRRWLENRTSRLIGEHGTFSQYSLNYHRVVLDTLSMVEVWRRTIGLPAFSERWQERCAAASRWLYRMVSPEEGDGPNIGANDGANLLPLADTDYRDYRGSVQLAMALFADSRAYAGDGPWNHGLAWLDVSVPSTPAPEPASYVADDGGFGLLRRGTAMALLRYPRFRFRPTQSDILHLDFWIGGCNVLRDAGSYSYNTDPRWLRYFAGTASHNTVQFDDRDQMPRLGRFLFGEWLQPAVVETLAEDEGATSLGAGYRDREGATHHRRVRLSRGLLHVSDEVRGMTRTAVLRWRLAPGRWRLSEEGAMEVQVQQSETPGVRLAVRSSVPMVRAELVEGWESRYYTEKTPVPVLEIEIRESGSLSTEVTWQP